MNLSVIEQQAPDPDDHRGCGCGRPWEYRTGTFQGSRYWCSRCWRRLKGKIR